MFANLDIRFQSALASDFPGFLTNPTGGLERSNAVEKRLAKLRGESTFKASTAPASEPARAASVTSDAKLPGVTTPDLPILGTAPDFTDTQRWFNSPPLTMHGLRGRVVLVDFWTYTCINCLRTLPFLKAWDARYRADGLTIVGVHTPEFAFEKKASNVEQAIADKGLKYPVVQDNDYGTWNAWTNQAWPAHYLIDAQGNVRYVHLGEGDYKETEAAIRALLAEAGDKRLGAAAQPKGAILTVGAKATPETYIGSARAQGFSPVEPDPTARGTTGRRAPTSCRRASSASAGAGRSPTRRRSRCASATITAHVVGTAVYLVLSSRGDRPRRVQVRLDGKPISAADAGSDVHDGVVTVRRQRLYSLVKVGAVEDHVLTLRLDPGVSGYAFTFG